MNAPAMDLSRVEWRDLVALTPREKFVELTLSLPWLAGSLWCYHIGWWLPGLACSFYFFLTGLRQSHNAQHYALGLPRLAQDGVLFALSALMLASMHAVQATHLHHHRHCLGTDDTEGSTARQPGWMVLLTGPLFPLRLHVAAWRLAKEGKRGWIAAEVLVALVLVLAFIVFGESRAWRWHFAVMLVGECFTAFFAVWTVHHDCAAAVFPSRTQRGEWLNRIFYAMFFHTEHHLFPAVPTPHLPELARRLDAVAPEFREHQVMGWFHRKAHL